MCIGHGGRAMKSNDFADKWKMFSLAPPSRRTMKTYLANICKQAGIAATTDIIGDIVNASPTGDFRSCINYLEMHSLRPGEVQDTENTRDVFVDGIDAIEYMLRTDDKFSVRNAFSVYEQEPCMVSTGVQENYLDVCLSAYIATVSTMADSISLGDVFYEKMTSRGEFSSVYHCCASSANVKYLMSHVPDAPCPDGTIRKYGTIWSKMNNMNARRKKLAVYETKRQQYGLTTLENTDYGYMRRILRTYIDDRDTCGIRSLHPMDADDVLAIFRSGFEVYKHLKTKQLFKSLDVERA